jgi:hypothetical protein
VAAVVKRADDRAKDLAPVVAELQADGVASLRKIAEALTERGITAPRAGRWSARAGPKAPGSGVSRRAHARA